MKRPEVREMKRVIVITVLAVFMGAMGCAHVPKKSQAHVSVDIRQEVQQRTAASLDFIEGKTDALPDCGLLIADSR